MKILLLGDASNCHRTLATGLRNLGHEVVVVSDGTAWMQTERDIDISRRSTGKLGGLSLYLRMLRLCATRLRGFDVVAVHNPIFLKLRPLPVRHIFSLIKRNNRSVFLTALGTDTPYVEECLDPLSPLEYNEFRHYGHRAPYALNHPEIERAWLTDPLRAHCDYIYSGIDGAVSILYEYHLALHRRLPAEKTAYAGIPVDVSSIPFIGVPEKPEKVRIFLGRHSYRQDIKGTDRFETAARRAIERHPGKGELIIVENRPYSDYLQLLSSAHVVLDQAYSYSPATNALLSMSYGQCVVSGGEEDYYRFIGETDASANRPVFNSPVDVEGMTALLEDIITAPPGALRERGMKSREFVEKHHSADIVAGRFLDFWEERLSRKH